MHSDGNVGKGLVASEMMPAGPGAVLIIASALAGLLAWVIWHRARQAGKFDLHKIPGPPQAYLLGNLASVIGSSYVHRVRRLVLFLPNTSLLGTSLHAGVELFLLR